MIQLKAKVSSNGKSNQSTPISLYNGNTLIAKTEVDFVENQENTVTFDIENNGQVTEKQPWYSFAYSNIKTE